LGVWGKRAGMELCKAQFERNGKLPVKRRKNAKIKERELP